MKKLIAVILLALLAIAITGCNTGGPKAFVEPKIDQNLSTPKNIMTLSGVTSIGFEWDRVADHNIEGFVVYRSEGDGKLFLINKITSRFATHYADLNLKPNQEYNYRISTYDARGFESEPSKTVTVKTADFPEPISYIDKVENLPRMAKLVFRPHANPSIDSYVVERRTPPDDVWKEVGAIKGRLNAEFIDMGLEDSKSYEYRVFAITFDGVKSHPSEVASTVTKSLPSKIVDVEASKNLPKKIKLAWLAPKNVKGAAYNVYASDFQDGPFSLKATVSETQYEEAVDEDGKAVYYKITVIDKDKLESKMAEKAVQGVSKPKPLTPTITKAEIVDAVPVVEFSSRDVNVAEFKITRVKIIGLFTKETVHFTGLKERVFRDTSDSFVPNFEYQYSVTAIDNDGLESVPSEKVSLMHKVEEKSK